MKTKEALKDYLNPVTRELQNKEWEAWVNIWNLLSRLTGKTKDELNRNHWRKLATAIEEWSYQDRLLRISQNRIKEREGVFI